MLKVDHVMNLLELKAQGLSIRRIAELSGHSRNTVRKILRGEHELAFQTPERVSKLDPFKDYVRKRYEEAGLSAVRLIAEIKPMGYQGSLVVLRRYLKTLKHDTQVKRKLTVRFETPPGQQAQADWAYCGRFKTPDGKAISVYAFAMVLSFSRMLFVRFTTSMKMRDLLACHQLAFEYFNGIPATILYDNMKQVRVGPGQLNEQFVDFAGHYGFVPKTHRPYRPRTKGKVERSVDYLKDNFLAGRDFVDLDDLNRQGFLWMEQTANPRIHGTTQQRPVDLFAQESLTPFAGVAPYRFVDPVKRTVNWEAMIAFQGSRYSVPPLYAGQHVEVVAEGGSIFVRSGDTIIAEHRQALQQGQCIVEKAHLAELWKITEQQIKPPQEASRMRLTFDASVQRTPLTRYEEVSA